MSCITEILKRKGDAEVLYVPQEVGSMCLVVEGGSHYKGYEYLITFNDMGFRCGYVALSPDHKFYANNFYDEAEELNVHGGITFYEQHSLVESILGKQCSDKWIGFDAGHCYDIVDLESTKKYFPDLHEVRLNHVVSMSHLFECRHETFAEIRTFKYMEFAEIRTFKYMEDECKYLIDQLIEKSA